MHSLPWTIFPVALSIAGLLALAACGTGPRLVNETDHGATVIYPVTQDADVLSSHARRTALALMSEKCPTGYHIVREGEVPNVGKTIDHAWMGQVVMDKRWAIQFTCKE